MSAINALSTVPKAKNATVLGYAPGSPKADSLYATFLNWRWV